MCVCGMTTGHRRFSLPHIFCHERSQLQGVPHRCGSLVEPLLCAVFLPPDFCLFLVTKILSRGILQKYLRGSPSFESTFWGTPWLLNNWWTMSIFPVTFQTPFAPSPSQVPYHVPKIFLRIVVLPKYLLGYPLAT